MGSTYVLPLNNANSIGFYCAPPTNGQIAFEGSWDGIVWEPATLRQMGTHGYSTVARTPENYIGSCATFKYLRFRTAAAGSGPGTLAGKLTYAASTLEGIEHGWAPHKIGQEIAIVTQSIGTICTNQVLYTPHSYHRVAVSDIWLNTDGATAVTLSEAGTRVIFRANLRPNQGVSSAAMSYRVPVPFRNQGAPLCFSNSATQIVDINITLYETED